MVFDDEDGRSSTERRNETVMAHSNRTGRRPWRSEERRPSPRSWNLRRIVLLTVCCGYFDPALLEDGVHAFATPAVSSSSTATKIYRSASGFRSFRATTSALFAAGGGKKKKKKKKKKQRSGGGTAATTKPSTFGGGAFEPCPCGQREEGEGTSTVRDYASCCGVIHRDMANFVAATPTQVVQARYSAYAKKLPEFLIKSTHPQHPDFQNDLKAWKASIQTNMFDNFELSNCAILDVDNMDNEEDAALPTVKFQADMIYRATGEQTAFRETSTFQRAIPNGPWLYRSGIIHGTETEIEIDLDPETAQNSNNPGTVLGSKFTDMLKK